MPYVVLSEACFEFWIWAFTEQGSAKDSTVLSSICLITWMLFGEKQFLDVIFASHECIPLVGDLYALYNHHYFLSSLK